MLMYLTKTTMENIYQITLKFSLFSLFSLSPFTTLQFQTKVPQLIIFWIFCHPPHVNNFLDFILRIFQRLLKPIAPFAKL